jgi:hypothetical protein
MKKSEAKEYIKELIISELTEVDADPKSGAVVMKKGSNPSDIKKLTAQGIDVELKEEEDDIEPTAKDIAANASIAKLQSKYGEVVKQMKSIVNKYKSAEGIEKQKYVGQLKDLTKLKKELEAMINPSMDDEDEI